MNLNLNIPLQKNTFYSNAGNIFSKLILLRPLLLKEESFLVVVENDNKAQVYKKIAKELGIIIDIVDNFSDFVNLVFNKKGAFVVSKDIFNLDIVDKNFLETQIFTVKKGNKISPQDLAKELSKLGFEFGEYGNINTFSIIGDVFSFVDKFGKVVKISFWGDEIDEILFENEKLEKYSFGKNLNLISTSILQPLSSSQGEKGVLNFFDFSQTFIILDNIDFYNKYDEILPKLSDFLVFLAINPVFSSSDKIINLGFKDLIINTVSDLKILLEDKNINQKYIITKNTKIINNYLNLNNLEDVVVLETSLNNLKSFKVTRIPNPSPDRREENRENIVICDDNISRIFVKKRIKRSLSENLDLALQIKKGDFVVHIDHGIGIFSEIVEKELGGIKKEYLMIEYKDNDKLFVPITEVSRLSKYVGIENPKLTALSTKDWERKLAKANEDTTKIANELLEIFAKRKLQKGFSFEKKEELENDFFNSFEYIYTDDQFNVIKDIFKDMESPFPMDRLLSGDVGFGKTEVAFASIFKAIVNGKQAALISPLVVLAYEHYEKALFRFSKFPFNIAILTRFESVNDVKDALKKLEYGKIDLIIGTHRLLSEDVKFKDLGLLVVDEEHKFGVRDKEKLKTFKGNVDILSMSATPIPRSLNLALNGLKQVSMLTTPPVGKQAIETIVTPFDDKVILDASKQEFARGGQIFFIHNRVETILGMQSYLEKLLPGKKIIIAHGQLSGDQLERNIISFKRREYDVLLATTVIENGIDFSNVNTIFINDANNFGISQIHQLRGRVGRAGEKAYAYLLFKKDKIKEDATKRLKTIVDYSHLGAGFELAVKDLEIRGGGDILGIRQSGSSIEIGISLFLEMLEDKIEKLKSLFGEEKEDKNGKLRSLRRINTTIDLNIEAYLPNDFFTSELDKLNFYREIESIKDLEDLENLLKGFEELMDDTQKINSEDIKGLNIKSVKNLFDLIKLRILASNYKVRSIKKVGINYQIDFEEDTTIEQLKRFLILDNDVKFSVVTPKKLRSSIKNFTSEEKFVKYLLSIFETKDKIRKIRLNKKTKSLKI